MKTLEANFIVSDAERGTLLIEFSYSQTTPGAAMVRVWQRADFGSDRPPLLELPNVGRRYKPCASHVADLVKLAFRDEPDTVFGQKRAAATARDEFQRKRPGVRYHGPTEGDVAKTARQRQRRPKFKLIGGPT